MGITIELIRKWAEAKLKENAAILAKNHDDPDRLIDSLFVNGKHAAMIELLCYLDGVDEATGESQNAPSVGDG